MTAICRHWAGAPPAGRRSAAYVIAFVVQMAGHATAFAQDPPEGLATRTELPTPSIVAAPSAMRRSLERLRWLTDNQSWTDAADLANKLLTEPTDGWVAIDDSRYMGVREAVHRALVAGGPEALTPYRSLVDPLAQTWLRDGEAKLDAGLLLRVSDEAYASSVGDDALWSLGDLALERGQYQFARWAWQQIRPETTPAGCLSYPDSPLELAAVRARLALVSIRAGDLARARHEMAQLAEEHPNAMGRLGGREVNYAERLGEMLKQARSWPPADRAGGDWPTLAARPERTNVARISLTPDAEFESLWSVEFASPQAPIVEATSLPTLVPRTLRPIFPIVADGLVVFQDAGGIHAYSLATGKPAGGDDGLLYETATPTRPIARGDGEFSLRFNFPTSAVTVDEHRVLAISPGRTTESEGGVSAASQLVGLDLTRDRAVAFHREPSASDAQLAGPPVVSRSRAVVVELQDAGSLKASLAAFDFWRRKPLWRRGLGATGLSFAEPADAPAAANAAPCLAADGAFVYLASNQGFIAAVRADDGAPVWLRTYARKAVNDGAAYARMLDARPYPCVVQESIIVVAPQDSGEIFALDAASGVSLWSRPLPAFDAHIAAVFSERIFLSGDRLWALDLATGEIDPQWGEELRNGAGQGALAGDVLLWPTQDAILLIDRNTGKPAGTPINLPDAGGANLAVAAGADGKGQYIVAAGPKHITVFRQKSSNPASP